MPWHQEPTKDAASCEKLRVVASKRHPQISEWGNPSRVIPGYPLCGGAPGELKHLSNLRKRDSPSSGERTGKSLNQLRLVALLPIHSWGGQT
jgi:hypothetical protein